MQRGAGGLEFRVLGSVHVGHRGRQARPMGRMQQALLGMLLVRANRPVPAESLIDALWGSVRDQRARKKLQFHVHKLRSSIADPDRIESEQDGYRLVVLPDELDAERFESLVDAAAELPLQRAAEAAALLHEALTLWRTDAYHGLEVPEIVDEAARLQDRRLIAVEQLYGAELACDRHDSVVGPLSRLARQHPLRERLHGLLVTALYRCGRPADALVAYRAAHRTMVDEVGIEPGPQLRDLQRRILAGEPVPT